MHRSRILRTHVLTISEAAVRDRTVEAMARMAPVQVHMEAVIQAPMAEAPMAEGIAQAHMAVPMEAGEGVAQGPMPAPTEAAEGIAQAPTVAPTAVAEGTARDPTVEAVVTVQGLTGEAGVTARVRAVVIAAVRLQDHPRDRVGPIPISAWWPLQKQVGRQVS